MPKKEFAQNDHELLYLIKQHNEAAMEEMLTKYEPLILKMISQYGFPVAQKEDYLQEGRLVLLKAIDNYQEEYNKTFTKYFELLLKNRFNTLYREFKKHQNQVLLEDVDALASNEAKEETVVIDLSKFSDFEKKLYQYCYIEKHTIPEAASLFGVERKTIYNAIGRIKKKVDKMNSKNKYWFVWQKMHILI